MVLKIIGLIIGLLVFTVGLYYRAKEKSDAEARKIYAVAAAVGAVIAVVSLLALVL